MSQTNWKESKLYLALKDRKGEYAERITNLLERPEVMDKIELILNKGGNTPKNFTLHDADHSFRVAERMWELIPSQTKEIIGEYELGLLLLSAYLHDIGMSPDFEKVQKHKTYLTTGDKSKLSVNEIEDFQEWVDNNNSLKAIDISQEIIGNEKLSDYILSYYIRSRHNDWSGEWIQENLKQLSLKNYDDWINDLILICKSHHEGLEHLKSDAFDPKPIQDKQIIHRRYMAMCLRVADVMENDPERTPEVILQHRMIDDNSLIYWLKDKKFNLIRKENDFSVYARPERALIHKAIEETTDWIENELKLCEELIKIKPLNVCPFCDLESYGWEIGSFIHRDIVPKDDLYVYINSGFRPNTTKILDLLGGNQLYGDPKWAYREIFQNSLDAVKERIAYQVVNDTSKTPELISSLFGKLYTIDISLDMRKDGDLWLVVKDQGVGMTKSIIEKYFLESGSSKRHEISSLERRCKERGFNFTRTGQFGIGVLSYFMIAEKIIIKTKRELNTGYNDRESISWQFEISGTHDFGELKKYSKPISGTEIEFKLKPFILEDLDYWNNFFKTFIKEVLKKSPCSVTYSSNVSNTTNSIEPGWTNTTSDVKNAIIADFISATKSANDKKFISSEKENLILKNNTLAAKTISEITDNMDFLYAEGNIENFGQYRLFIPYFKLNGGKTFYYLKEENRDGVLNILKIRDGHIWQPKKTDFTLSLKGITIRIAELSRDKDRKNYIDYSRIRPVFENVFVDLNIDEIEEGEISISRHDYIANNKLVKASNQINAAILNLIAAHKTDFDNVYGSLNFKYTEIQPETSYWTFPSQNKGADDNLVWREIKFPVMIYDLFNYGSEKIYKGQKIDLLQDIRGYSSSTSPIKLKEIILKTYMVEYSSPYYFIKIIVDQPILYSNKKTFKLIQLADQFIDVLFFDPEFSSFLTKIDNIYLNVNSKLYKYYDCELYESLPDNSDLNEKLETIDKSNLKKILALLLSIVVGGDREHWIGICEKKTDAMQTIFNLLKVTEFRFIKYTDCITIALNKWESKSVEAIINKK